MSELVGPYELYKSEKALLMVVAVATLAIVFTLAGIAATPDIAEPYITRVGNLLLAEAGTGGVAAILAAGSAVLRPRRRD